MLSIDGDYIHLDRSYINNKKDCSRANKVYLDFHVMQYCDMAVIGSGGFGYTAMLNRPEPLKNLYRFSNKKFIKL
ncbi:unnamed protein product [Brachionus calyciflorus]|uniref:Uncharacterized protein n=1 Tax=Brachionus calyciflorus TaxID=104777 RepID=A0A814HSE4_9BILA|nr:unnamed protein product [Brachionus calyciflorus]